MNRWGSPRKGCQPRRILLAEVARAREAPRTEEEEPSTRRTKHGPPEAKRGAETMEKIKVIQNDGRTSHIAPAR